MVSALGGADISWLAGFVVAGGAYLVSSRLAAGPALLPHAEAEVGPALQEN